MAARINPITIRASVVPNLVPQTAHIWKVDLVASQKNVSSYWKFLSEDEKKRAKRFRFSKDENCFIISRGVLRMLLGEYLQRKPTDLIFEYGENGKPSLPNEERLQFNVSHSNEVALIGFVRNYPIGVDVEWIKADIELKDLAKRFFSNNESKKLLSFSDSLIPQAFYNCWTRKEAFIKAKGDGLSFPLDQFEVSMAPGKKAELLATHWEVNEKEKWSLFAFDAGENYAAALAVEGKINEFELFECEHIFNQPWGFE